MYVSEYPSREQISMLYARAHRLHTHSAVSEFSIVLEERLKDLIHLDRPEGHAYVHDSQRSQVPVEHDEELRMIWRCMYIINILEFICLKVF